MKISNNSWESLCKRCGKCCNHFIFINNKLVRKIPCKYFDKRTKTCLVYENRSEYQKDCERLTPEIVEECYKLGTLPKSCAYVKQYLKVEKLKQKLHKIIMY